MLHFSRPAYYLTEFSGDWIYEATMSTTPLNFGKKVLDTKLGARANMFTPPMFILSLDKESSENEGEVILGTLGWTGNFRFTFEVDNKKDPVSYTHLVSQMLCLGLRLTEGSPG